PTDKFSVPNTPNFTIPNINVETSKDKITPKFTMPNINVVEQPTTVSKVESTSPYDLHDLGDQEFTEDELRKNKQFLKDARTIYRNQKKKDWAGSSEDLGSWLLNRQSRVGWNLTNAGLTAFDAQTWSPEVKAAWYRSMDMYDRTDPTWRSAGKAAFWTLFDLPTIATAGWGPALRAVAGPTSNLAIRYSFKEMLKRALNIELKETFGKKVVGKTVADLGEKRVKEIRKEVAKRVAWRNALENYGTIGAAYSGLFDIAHQSLDQEVDPYKDDFDYKQFAQNSLLGYGIGGALGYTVPRVIEKFTRGKAIRNLQEEEIVREAELNPSDFNFDKHSIEQQKIAAEGNPETKIGKDAQGSSAVVDFVSKIAQIFNRKNIKPEIHDFGAGLPDDTGKIPSQKILEDAADITYTAEELAANVEKARRRKLQPYIKEGEKPTGTKQIVFASNLAGRYSSRALFGAVLDKTMPQLHPKTGMYILNTGKRATRNIGDDIVDDTGIPRKGTEQRDNVEREFIEEIIEGKVDPKTGEVSPPTVRKKEVVGLSNSDIEKLMNNRFVNVKKFKVKGETIYVGSEPRLFTPFRKFNRIAQPKSKLRTIFSFRKNWTDSDAGTPKELDYYAAAKRNSIKKSIRSIQQVLTKRYHPSVEKFWSSRVLNSDSNPARYWKDFTDPERITANRIADDFLRNTIDEKDLNKIPTEVKNELISMRKNITNLQKKLEESGYIEEGSDLMATIQSSRGENNFLGMPELYLNRQYEIYDNAPKWIRKVLASQGDPEGVYEKARSFFKKQLREDKEILKDSTYGPMAEELQALYAVKYNNKILEYTGRSPYVGKGRRWSDMTDSMKEQINNRVDEIEGGEVDNIVSHFLREYSPEELESIKRLGAQGYFQSMKAGEGSPIKGAFYARKEIPTPIRNLLGEYKNPNINYANTIMKLNQTYDNYKYEKAIQDLAQTGQFPDVILPQKDRFGNPLKTIGGRDLQEASALAQYAPGTDRPLANLKADDVIFDAIKQGNELMPILNPAFKTILGLQAATRLSKTAYSVAAFPRNFTGAMLKTLGAGNLNLMNMRHFGKIIKGLKAYTDDELSAEIEKGLHLGFLDSGARAGSLKAGLEDYFGTGGEAALTDAGVFLGKNPGDLTTGSWFMKKLSRANRRVLDAYQSMDDMWKYYSFINEKQNYRTILKDNGVDPDFVIEKWTTAGGQKVEITELDKYAARMVRDHMDNYGEVARGVKFMRRLPTADFLAYKTEQFRTTNNIFRTALRDI
ncbi:MAG TPA: hypothetical protein DCS66_06515, partial [Flavobacteriaceae bacterium]|nr:hypothetical protein [Flavobacteriaceae bacterium]